MAKRSRSKSQPATARTEKPEGSVGPRQPCPCGSGKRYKACHGAPGGAGEVYVARPFAGLPGECDLVAMRELVPAATAPLVLREDVPGAEKLTDRTIILCSLLPMAAPAMARESGQVWLGLQVQHDFGDPSRDLAAVLLKALAALGDEPGIIGLTEPAGDGPRLQDLVEGEALEVTVHEGFEYWIADVADNPEVEDALEGALDQANESATPTSRLSSVTAAYWTNVGPKEHLRWVLPESEGDLLDALARLHVSGEDVIAEGARLVGMFRTQGLLAPVWDLPVGTGAEALEEPAATFRAALDRALARDRAAERRGALCARGPGQPAGHDPLSLRPGMAVQARRSDQAESPGVPLHRQTRRIRRSPRSPGPARTSFSASCAPSSTTTVPGRATDVRRAAMLTVGPKTSPSRLITSP